jgi:hypothetical protein
MGGARKMKKSNRPMIRSRDEFEKLYFPKRYEEQKREEITDPEALGIDMANRSLEKIKNLLA